MLTKIIRFLLLLCGMALALFPCQASAVGIGAAPPKLDFNIYPHNSATEALYVINTGDSEACYKVRLDDEYEDWFDITPVEFSLAPQAKKEVQITVSPPMFASGDHITYIYVVGEDSSPQLNVNAGIKIPVHIHISNRLPWIGIAISAFILIAFLLWQRKRLAVRETR